MKEKGKGTSWALGLLFSGSGRSSGRAVLVSQEGECYSPLTHFKEIFLGVWEILMSFKCFKDLHLLLGILVKYFNFLFCDVNKKRTTGEEKGLLFFYHKYPRKCLRVRWQ